MPQENIDALGSSTLTKADGTIISGKGVILPDGTRMTHAEYNRHTAHQEDANKAFDGEVRDEFTGRSRASADQL